MADNKQNLDKDTKDQQKQSPSKPFMTMGPTFHYSHANVLRCWWLAVIVYCCTCFFWSQVLLGDVDMFKIQGLGTDFNLWTLGHYVKSPVSIYEYPWHIFVLAVLTAIIAFMPVLIAQLFSFSYSILPIIVCLLLAKLPGLASVLLISCFMVACRPLRFRSRFISVVLCSSPILIYLILSGKAADPDPLRWGLSFAPWLLAWLLGLTLCGIVLSIGHFTRYKPGQIWLWSSILLVLGIFTFFDRISFAESNYKLYIQRNAPESIENFQPRDISNILDKAASNPLFSVESGLILADNPRQYREQLISELQEMLSLGTWPFWFIENCDSDFYDYERKRSSVIEQYDFFVAKHKKNHRVASALYYKAILNEYQPDIPAIRELEQLKFYCTYPRPEVYPDWIKLYKQYPDSVESIEARWRIAVNLAGKQKFNTAASLCREILSMAEEKTKIVYSSQSDEVAVFRKPAETVITPMDLNGILFKTKYLLHFLSGNYLEVQPDLLASFLKLDKRSLDYFKRLQDINSKTPNESPLKDNLELEIIKKQYYGLSIIENLTKFANKYKGSDGELEAEYLLGKNYTKLWIDEQDPAKKLEYLNSGRAILKDLVERHKDSLFFADAAKILSDLPKEE